MHSHAVSAPKCSKTKPQAYLEHSSEAHLLVISGRSEVHGSSHIGGAAVKLAATVQQQQGVLVYLLATALLGSVVDDGPVPISPCRAFVL